MPRALWLHLLERVQQREVTRGDLSRLQEWVRSDPEAPAGDWYKDFGSFKRCGSGEFPRTVLTKHMKAYGQPID